MRKRLKTLATVSVDSLSDWELDSSRRLKADLLSRSEVDHAPCGTSLKGDGNVAKSSGWLASSAMYSEQKVLSP